MIMTQNVLNLLQWEIHNYFNPIYENLNMRIQATLLMRHPAAPHATYWCGQLNVHVHIMAWGVVMIRPIIFINAKETLKFYFHSQLSL